MSNNNNQYHQNSERSYWGIFLVVIAIALIVNKLGFLKDFSIWSITLTIVSVAILFNGILRRSIGGILFPIAFLIILHDEFLGLEAITPWPVLGAAILATAGLNMLFPHFGKKPFAGPVYFGNAQGMQDEKRNNNTVYYQNHFGTSVKYLKGAVSEVYVKSDFGSFDLYLTEAELIGNSGSVHVNSSMGEVKLYVPAGWNVVTNIHNSFASVEKAGVENPQGVTNLLVNGNVSFGSLKIIYV